MPVLIVALAIGTLAFAACAGGDAGGDDDAGDLTAAIAIEDFAFTPVQLEVGAGTAVTWTNHDRFAHTVTADDNTFDSGDLTDSGSFEQTFDQAGSFSYHCAIHNYMTGTITVS